MRACPGSVSTMVAPLDRRMVTSVFHMRWPRSSTQGSMTAMVGSSWTVIRPLAGS